MTTLEIPVPDSLLAALCKAPHEMAGELRIAASIHWYQQSELSMERAAETAGMTRAEFLSELARRRVDVFAIDDEDLAPEIRCSTVTVMIPDDTFATVRRAPDEVARDMRIAVAVRWYQLGLVSQGKGAEIAGLTRADFLVALSEFGISASQESAEVIREVLSRG